MMNGIQEGSGGKVASTRSWQRNDKPATATVGRFLQNQAAMIPDDLPANRQTKSDSTTGLAAGKKRIEQMPAQIVVRNARSLILNGEHDSIRFSCQLDPDIRLDFEVKTRFNGVPHEVTH